MFQHILNLIFRIPTKHIDKSGLLFVNIFKVGKIPFTHTQKSIMKHFFPVLLLFSLTLFSVSCNKLPIDDVDTTVEAELAVPLLDTKTTVKDMLQGLDSSYILRFEADGQVIAQYTAYANSKTTLDPFNSLPTDYIPLLDTAASIPFAPPGGLKINTADLKKGMSNMLVYNNLPEALTITFRIPQLVKNGVAYKKTFSLAASASAVKDSLDLAGYSLTVNNDEIKVYYDAIKNSNGQRVKLLNVQFAFKNLQGKYVKGYFGVNTLDAPKDSFKLGFMDKLTTGDVRFSDPKITLTVDNSYGIPVRTSVKSAEVVMSDKKRMNLTGSFVSNGMNLNYPALTETGYMKSTQIILDKSNSNIVDMINSKPASLVFDIDGVINPDGNKSITGFFTDSSYLKMKMNIEVPIYGTVKSFEERDTLDITLPSNKDVDHFEVRVIADNGTALNASLQTYFLDANNKVIDSLFASPTATLLKAGAVDASGKVTTAARQISNIQIDAAKMTRLQSTKKAILKYTFSTINNGTTPIRLYSNQEVKVKLSALVGVKRK